LGGIRREIEKMKNNKAEKANAQIAHLQFTQANAKVKNCKRAIFYQP